MRHSCRYRPIETISTTSSRETRGCSTILTVATAFSRKQSSEKLLQRDSLIHSFLRLWGGLSFILLTASRALSSTTGQTTTPSWPWTVKISADLLQSRTSKKFTPPLRSRKKRSSCLSSKGPQKSLTHSRLSLKLQSPREREHKNANTSKDLHAPPNKKGKRQSLDLQPPAIVALSIPEHGGSPLLRSLHRTLPPKRNSDTFLPMQLLCNLPRGDVLSLPPRVLRSALLRGTHFHPPRETFSAKIAG